MAEKCPKCGANLKINLKEKPFKIKCPNGCDF
jgi:rRNA maturation protein Nop10